MEKNYLLYDRNYLGPGYFIVHKKNDKIISFFKFYKVFRGGFPNFNFRAWGINAFDNPDKDFTDIEFKFDRENDSENGLYDVLSYLPKVIHKELSTVDKFHHGDNKLKFEEDEDIVKITASKDTNNKNLNKNFIDIDLGDDMTCFCYYTLAMAYNKLEALAAPTMTEDQIGKILSLKMERYKK